MIPILYLNNDGSYTSNGIGRLSEILSCTVTEERNGIYECEFEYPVTGKYYQTMAQMVNNQYNGSYGGVIVCYHDDRKDAQPFDLYSVSSPIDGIATFSAHHISYRLCNEVVKPFSASSVAQVIGAIPDKSYPKTGFTFWTDKVTSGNFEITTPRSIRSILGGEEGSILDVYGSGEYEFDKFNVKLYQHRGVNSGVTIRYGKNLIDLTREQDSSGIYNAIAPYWTGADENNENEEVTVYLDELYVLPSQYSSSTHGGGVKINVVDLSGDFDSVPTQAQLRARAINLLDTAKPWRPDDTITVDFVQLWQTIEYKNVAALQRVSLCDTVSVYFPEFGIIEEEQEVVKVVYDVLLERYNEMELGTPSSSLASNLRKELLGQYENELKKLKDESYSMLDAAVEHATQLITGGLGGHVIFTLNADGKPEEILIMDTDDKDTAVNVWRFNSGGLGHSHSGYNGPFNDVALTMDGAINANMITTGQLNANLIKAGIIQDQKQYNYWNMQTGEFQLKAYATTEYTDTKASGALSSAKSYADTKTAAALSSAKTYSDGKLSDYDTNLNQAKIFNKLTNNGALKGIYMKNNNLYINASYIYSGTLKLGGNNNENGLFEVLDKDGNIAILANKDGIIFDSEIWYYYKYTNNTTSSVYYYNGDQVYTDYSNETALNTDLAAGYDFYKKRSLIKDGEIQFYRRVLTKNKKVLSTPTIEHAGGISSTAGGLKIYTSNTVANQALYFKGGGTSISLGGSFDYLGNSVINTNNTITINGNLHMRTWPICLSYYNSANEGRWTAQAKYHQLSLNFTEYYDGAAHEGATYYFSQNGTFQCEKVIIGSLDITDVKAKLVTTEDYGKRRLYCYETPTPSFGDIGEGTIDETGYCYIYLEPIFAETISNDVDYQVFLQNYGIGSSYVYSKTSNYFVVKGDPGLHFAWEIKAKQLGYSQYRLDKREDDEFKIVDIDYGESAANYIELLIDGRMEE